MSDSTIIKLIIENERLQNLLLICRYLIYLKKKAPINLGLNFVSWVVLRMFIKYNQIIIIKTLLV